METVLVRSGCFIPESLKSSFIVKGASADLSADLVFPSRRGLAVVVCCFSSSILEGIDSVRGVILLTNS
jgi:hypothetical protein